MWLLITSLAAVVASALWYINAPADKYRLSLLSLLLWGATIMWFVDHVMAFAQEGGEFFEVTANATALGLSVLLLALFVWIVVLLVSDPKRVFRTVVRK